MIGPNQKLHCSGFLKPFLRILRVLCSYYQEPVMPMWYTIYSAILIFLAMVIPFTFNTIKVIKSLNEVEKALEVLILCTTNAAYTFKVYCFVSQKEDVKQLLKDIDSEIFQPRNGHQETLIVSKILTAKGYIKICMWVTCITCVLVGITPLVNNDEERFLPMTLWYPVLNTSKSPAYEIIYVYECTFLMIHGFSHISLESIPIILMAFVIGQLNVVADTLRKLKEYAKQDICTSEEDKTTETHVEMNKLLIQNVYKHRALRRLVNDLNKVYTNHFFTILANCIIDFALLLYQLAMETSLSWTFMYILFHFCTLMTQLLLYNWYGNEITFKSSTMYIAAYAMDWPGTPILFQRNLLFTLIHFQVPMKIYACNFFLLCLESYVNVLRSSWSYFLMLTSLNDN